MSWPCCALGASGGQVRRLVIIEAAITGVVGSLLGVAAGWGLARGLLRLMADTSMLGLDLGVTLSSIALGIVITVVAALLPARRAARVAPVVAMRGMTTNDASRRVAQTAGRVPVFGWVIGRLAALNARRQPGRTIATASTLTIGLFLVGVLSVFGASMKASIAEMLPNAMGSDVMIMADDITAQRVNAIKALPEVSSVHAHGLLGAKVGDEQASVQISKPADYGTVVTMTMAEGRQADKAGELVVTSAEAATRRWSVDQRVEGVANGQSITWQIVGFFDYPANISAAPFVTHPDTLALVDLPANATTLAVRLADGVTVADAKAAMAGEVKRIPGATVVALDEYNRVMGAQVDMIMNGVYGLIGLSIVIATLSIVNTLGLSVVERERELGLLRTIGTTCQQVRALVTSESLIISVLGGGLGLGLGVVAGIALQRGNVAQLPSLAIPWAQMGGLFGAIILLGVIAALAPASRAARTPVLQAIQGS